MKIYTFRTIIEPDENNTYHGWVPILKGCHTSGNSVEETRHNLKDAIKVYVLSLREDGEPVPKDQGFEFVETFTESDFEKEKIHA